MVGDVRVLEDGAERSTAAKPPTPPWVWIIVGLAIGIGFAVVFVTPSSTDPVEEATEETAPDLGVVEGPDVPIGVATAIPEFPDALVAVTMTGTRSLEHLLWPIAGDPITRGLPVGAFGAAEFDAAGTWLAVSTLLPDTGEEFLSMGKPSGLGPLASNVTSFSWHDSESGLLAYTQPTEDGVALLVSKSDRNPTLVTTLSEPTGQIVGWGDWGWAMQAGPNEIVLLNSDGELKTTSSGTVLDSHPDGWLLIDDDGLRLLSAGGGLRDLNIDTTAGGLVFAGALSPDLSRVATIGSIGLVVASVDGEPIVEVPFTTAQSRLEWSSDSRFVIIPFLSGVVVTDTLTGISYEELTEFTVIEASVIALNP